MTRLANTELRGPIQRREMFKTNSGSVFPRREGNLYVVYSYGTHFPMWVYDGEIDQWFGNSDKYSRTTSKHQSQTRPFVDMTMTHTRTLQQIIAWGGYTEYTAARVGRAA
jgi:hypothetical protein